MRFGSLILSGLLKSGYINVSVLLYQDMLKSFYTGGTGFVMKTVRTADVLLCVLMGADSVVKSVRIAYVLLYAC